MAVTVLTGRTQAAAVNYNYTTSGSTDWSSVPNSTYFYDLVDKLPHYKNPSGTVLEVFSESPSTDNYVTGGTYSSGTLTLNRQNGSVTITGLTTGYTLTSSAISSTLGYTPLSAYTDNYVTGGTYSSGTLTLNRQNGSVTINGLVSGDTSIYTTDGTLTGNRIVTMNANTLLFDGTDSDVRYTPNSAGGYLQLEGKDSGVPRFAVSITAYAPLSKPAAGFQLGMRSWDDVSFPGYGKIGDSFFYAGNETNGLNFMNPVGTGTEDYIRFYAGNNALATSDIHIQGTGATRGYVGINTETPTERLDVNGKTKTTTLQITSGAVNNYVLTSDASGNASWEPVTNSGAITGITINNNTNNYLLTAIGTANTINGESGARFDGVTLDLTKSSTNPNIIISDLGNTTTDAYIRIEASSAGTPTYAIGVDKSDLNKFKITYASNSTASPGSTKLFDIDYGSALPIYSLAYDSVLFNTAPNAGQIELHNRASSITSSFTQFAGFTSLSANNGDTGTQPFYINNDSVSGWTSFGGGGVNDLMYLVNENRVDLPGITGGNGLYIKNDLSVNGLVRVGAVTSTGVAVYRNATTGILTTTSSDERVKQNITQITGATEIVKNLTGVYYNWKNTEHFQTEDESRQIGLIAQEVEPHLPEAVVLNGISDYKTIKYSEMVSVLVESIKEQQLIIEDLKQRIINLENK